jgi:hypothetical protein
MSCKGSGFGFPDQEADRREIALLDLVFDSVYAYDGLPIFKIAVCGKWSAGICLDFCAFKVVCAVEIKFSDLVVVLIPVDALDWKVQITSLPDLIVLVAIVLVVSYKRR